MENVVNKVEDHVEETEEKEEEKQQEEKTQKNNNSKATDEDYFDELGRRKRLR